MRKFSFLIILISFLILIVGCSSSDSTESSTKEKITVNQVSLDQISGFSVNGIPEGDRATLNNILDDTIKAFSDIDSIELTSELRSESDTFVSSIQTSATGSTEALKNGDEYIQYTEVSITDESTEVGNQEEKMTVQTYATIKGTKATGYREASSGSDSEKWVESSRNYTKDYSFTELLDILKDVDNNNISLNEDDDFYYISAKLSLYDYWSYQPFQLSYSQDIADLLENSKDEIEVTFAIDNNSNLLSGILTESIDYSKVDLVSDSITGRILTHYDSYNSISSIPVPEGVK